MVQNILITGAAGYIGGTLLADLVSRTNGPIKEANLSVAVRTEEQARALSKRAVNVLQLDSTDEDAVWKAVTDHQIDIVVHFASSFDQRQASHLIKALGKRRKVSKKEVYFIHSSVSAIYAAETGWPFGEIKDSDPKIFEKETQIQRGNPVRDTNIVVVTDSKEQGVTSMIVVVPLTYGRGTGDWKKLSQSIPGFVRVGIQHRKVFKFDKEGNQASAHVTDVAALYAIILEKVLSGSQIPNGESGYYFAFAHRAPAWSIAHGLAESLHARGLVDEPLAKFWPSDEIAAEYLGWPRAYVRPMGTARGELVAINAFDLGWQPKWDQERFLASMDDEVSAVQELDTIKSSLYNDLK